MRIVHANTVEEIQQARGLLEEYAAAMGFTLCFQNFGAELAELPGKYAPPTGRLLLAIDGDKCPAGCIALRKVGPHVCEMKRLFVRPEYRGQSLGRVLVNKLIDEARNIGYTHMRLDTLPGRMDKAIELYRSIGFVDISAYSADPIEGAEFLELDLQNRTKGTDTDA